MSKFYFITSSTDKFNEARSVMSGLEQLNVDLPEIQSLNPLEIIAAKIQAAKQHCEHSFVVEDSSLYISGLKSLPGPLVKWFLATLGTAGLADLALKSSDNNASARTVLGVVNAAGETQFVEAGIIGRIVKPRGKGFGWDSIFQPEGSFKTLGEMETAEKLSISMRGQAFRKLKLMAL